MQISNVSFSGHSCKNNIHQIKKNFADIEKARKEELIEQSIKDAKTVISKSVSEVKDGILHMARNDYEPGRYLEAKDLRYKLRLLEDSINKVIKYYERKNHEH